MKILKITNTLIVAFNTLFLFFKQEKQDNKVLYDKPIVLAPDRFYQKTNNNITKTPVTEIKNTKSWKDKYLDPKEDLDKVNAELIKGMSFDGQDLDGFAVFNPNKTIWNSTGQSDYEMFAIVNGQYIDKPWNQMKDTIKEGDEIVFVKKYTANTYLDGIYVGRDNFYCNLKGGDFYFKEGNVWLLEIKVPVLPGKSVKSIWKPVRVPSVESFCNQNHPQANQWNILLDTKDFQVDFTRPFEFGNMFFINNTFTDSKGYVELDSSRKAALEQGNIKIPYKAGNNIQVKNLRAYGDYQILKILNPVPSFRYWYKAENKYIKHYIASGFVENPEFANKKILTSESDPDKIIKNILKSNNYFGFNVYSNNFKNIKVFWGGKRQNGEIQSLTITMEGKNSNKNYNYAVWYEDVIKNNQQLKKIQEIQAKEEYYLKIKREENEAKIAKRKADFQQNFKLFHEKPSSVFNQKKPNLSIKKLVQNQLKSKKSLFLWLLTGIVFIGIISLIKEKK